jgi:hypothetical protein
LTGWGLASLLIDSLHGSATIKRSATRPPRRQTLADCPACDPQHGRGRSCKDPRASGYCPRRSEIVRRLSLGLIDLGIEKGDKVAILSNTRPEWTYFDFAALAAGATVVPIYQTNSPEECQYVLENSDSVAWWSNEEQLKGAGPRPVPKPARDHRGGHDEAIS